jgi:hypothetical protein
MRSGRVCCGRGQLRAGGTERWLSTRDQVTFEARAAGSPEGRDERRVWVAGLVFRQPVKAGTVGTLIC